MRNTFLKLFYFLFFGFVALERAYFATNLFSFDSKQGYNYFSINKTDKQEQRTTLIRRSKFSSGKTCLVMGSVNAGFCNQLWRFTGFIFLAAENNCSYILIENMFWKDTHGTNQFIPHNLFFDIDRWNSFHQDLPTFVSFIPEIDSDVYPLATKNITILSHTNETYVYNYKPRLAYKRDFWKNATKPVPIAHVNPNQSINRFKQTMTSIFHGQHPQPHENLYRYILSGALEPHAFIKEILHKTLKTLKEGNGFMTVHMRTEPDMLAQQRICLSKRVTSITNITRLIYEKYPKPPVKYVLLPVALDIMERLEQKTSTKLSDALSKIELLNQENLASIRKLLTHGMYDGQVKVLLAGSEIFEEISNPYYSHYKVFSGSVLNYFIALESNIFVGTETSSWSSSISNARMYRGNLENYFFDQNGLHLTTPDNKTKPHRFTC